MSVKDAVFLTQMISDQQKMLTQKLCNRFHIGKNGIRIGTFFKKCIFPNIQLNMLEKDYFKSKTCMTIQIGS